MKWGTAINLLDIAISEYKKNTKGFSASKKNKDNISLIKENTDILPEDASIKERVYFIENQLVEIPKCKICKSPVSFDKGINEYRVYCSKKCQYTDKNLYKKIVTRKKEIYGNGNNFQKICETNIKKYGSIVPIQNNEIKKKIKETNIKKYGVENPQQNKEIKEKTTKTLLEKYNSKSSFKHKNIEDINYEDIKKLNYEDKLTSRDIAKRFDVSPSYIQKLFKNNNEYMRLGLSSYEHIFLNKIKADNIILNDKKIISPYELDIVLPDFNLALEFNGSYWHSELQGKNKNYHLNKTLLCQKAGIHLIHIWEHSFNKNSEIYFSIINSFLGLNTRLYGRNLIIKEVNQSEEKDFLNKNHLQGYTPSNIALGLYHNETLYQILTLGTPRYNKKYEWEIIRIATKIDKTIIGGISKLLKHFKKKYNPNSIITYSDRSIFTGNVYSQLGFIFNGFSQPNYQYTNDYTNFYSRIKFQKHKLKKLFENYSSELSEWEIMKSNGYDRIWDCGNSIWIYQS